MEHVKYTQDEIEYDYYRITPDEMFKTYRTNSRNIKPWSTNYQYVSSVKLKDYKNKWNYKLIHASFDIETTSINEHSYMYIWQFGFITKGIQYVCKGRTWDEFENVMRTISNKMNTKDKIIVWVHNLAGYEFQFMRGRYHQHISNVFTKENNHPIKFTLFEKIEFRDTMSLCPKSLAGLAEDFCSARKLKGDLDYSKLRNSKTVLEEHEERYCDNDVIILSQYSEYVFNNLILDEKLPLTQTGILRLEINHFLKEMGIEKEIKDKIKYKFPSKRLYDLMMLYLFKGGISNANFTEVMNVLSDLDSYDFTSSYPAIMLQDRYYFPDEFTMCECETMEDFKALSKDYCVVAIFEFKNLTPKTKHNIISESKCIEIEKPLVLNGRVRQAKRIMVFETEIDIAMYEKFYDFELVKIHGCYKARKVKMPDYIRIPLLKAYMLKSKLKKEGKIYAVEKAKCNCSYGMMVQRLILGEWKYNPVDDTFKEELHTDFDEMIKGRFILPQVGIYITAWARYNLLCGILNYQETTYLYDTDSIKGHFDNTDYIDYYNNVMLKYNKILSDKYDIPFEYVADLGCWDCETVAKDKTTGEIISCKYERFKTLGAKRYIYTQNGEFKQTVAGLGKHALYNTCYKEIYGHKPTSAEDGKIHHNDVATIDRCFERFSDNMYIEDAEKLYHNNFGHVSDLVDGELMEEYSGVYLSKNEFTLRMKDIYVKYIEAYQDDNLLEERKWG